MSEWEPFRTRAVELFDNDENGNPPELGVCAHSHKVLEIQEMVPYGEALIATDAKQDFVQSLMETGKTMVVDATDSGVKYVGFWWRFLAIALDEMVKMVPNWIFSMIPYAALMFSATRFDDQTTGYVMAGTYFVYGLLTVAFVIFYETWMVGRFQGTVGKLVIGAKIVNPDGSRLTYGRAFIRWAAKNVLGGIICTIPPLILFSAAIALVAQGLTDSERPGIIVATIFFAMMVSVMLGAVFSAVYWMAAFDPEKRTLHDRVASTRVIKK